jgi:redox-sensitive bicupin YhaK (pirin superfamily)
MVKSVLTHLTIPSREADIGGVKVRRLLPWRERRMVGPFVFLDHMGPADFAATQGIDVPPHPHIGLATLTWLFEGEIVHRDTLGSHQAIAPGDVNWMAAGGGIAHSERSGNRAHARRMNGLQSWVALPKEHEDKPAGFWHHAAKDIPNIARSGVNLRVIAGTAYGAASPVKTFSPLFYVEARLAPGAKLELPDDYTDRGAYVMTGETIIGGTRVQAGTLPVFDEGKVVIEAQTEAHIMLLGGEPLPEPRFIWWNFVSSSKDRIEQAKEDWKAGKFGKIPGDEKEFVPLPETPKPGNIL